MNQTHQNGPTISSDMPARSQEEQQAFYESVLGAAHAAELRVGTIERYIAILGITVRLTFAGASLVDEFMFSLAHLEVPALEHSDAHFHVWDSASTGIGMVPPPVDQNFFTERGDMQGFNSTRYRSAFHWSELSVCVLDTAVSTGVYWIMAREDLPYWTRSSPMRSLFHWLLAARGHHLVHAAAVGTENGAVLVVGKGGVGKSSIALASLLNGMDYIGDDYLVVTLDPEPTACSLYSTAKLVPAQAKRFAALERLVSRSDPKDEKAVIPLYPHFASQLVRSMPIRYVLTPRFGSEAKTQFEPCSPLVLQRAAIFTTMSQLPHAGIETYRFIDRLIESVPSGRIVLGHDVLAVPGAIRELLAAPVTLPAAPGHNGEYPLASIIIPVYNGAHFLAQAIESILAQEYPQVEIIVIDDGSTDEIEAAVARLPVDVRLIRQSNCGPAAARNRGVGAASGHYIAFLDVDDLWPSGNLQFMVGELERHEKADFVLGRGQLARIDQTQAEGFRFEGSPRESYPTYIGAGLYRRRAFDRNGTFDETMRFGEDTDWFKRADENNLNVLKLEQISLIVRRHAGNMTRGKSMVELNALTVLKRALDRSRALPNS